MAVYTKTQYPSKITCQSNSFDGAVISTSSQNVIDTTICNFPGSRVRPVDLHASLTSGNITRSLQTPGIFIRKYKYSGNLKAAEYVRSLGYAGAINIPFLSGYANVNAASIDLRKSINSTAQSFAEHIGEYRETCGLFYKAAVLLYDCYQLRKGKIPPNWARTSKNLSKRKWTSKDVSAAWIGGHFAVAPVLSTINDFCYQHSGVPGIVRQKFKSAAIYQNKDYLIYSDNSLYRTYLLRTVRQTTKLMAYYDMNCGTPAFSTGNPAEWIWAATPFSFVVDWMLGVGSFLNALNDPPKNLKFIGCCQVDVYEATREFGIDRSYSNDPVCTYSPALDTIKIITRTPLASVPVPIHPKFTFPASPSILATAIALLHVIRK